MLAPDGTPLCRCDEDRANWYLSRGLATVDSTHPHLVFRLTFVPKGQGNSDDAFYLADKHNRCVVCGSEKNLTKHHCVPYCYRKHFPAEYKFHTSHDVLPCCISCHHRYESFAWIKKEELVVTLGIKQEKCAATDSMESRVVKHARALYLHGNKIPEKRREVLLQTLRDYFGKQEITSEDVAVALAIKVEMTVENDGADKVVSQQANLDAFVIMWRQHFVDSMQPQFLSSHWSVNNRTKRAD